MRAWASSFYLLKKVSKHSWPVMHCFSSVLHSPVGRQHLHYFIFIFNFNFIPIPRIITCVCACAHEEEIRSRACAQTHARSLTHALTFFLHHWRPSCCSISVDFLSVTFYSQLSDIHKFVKLQTRNKKTSKSQLGNLNEATGMQLVTFPIIWQFCFVSSLCSVEVS